MNINFVKTLNASGPYTPGTIYFESATNLIKIATAANQYTVFGGVRSAEWNASTKTLALVNEGGTEYSIDFSNFATAEDIPIVHNATLTIKKNGASIGTFTADASVDSSVNILVNELPVVDSSDNGKVLQVVNGEWTLVTPTSIYSGNGQPSNILGNNGDIYIQTQEG